MEKIGPNVLLRPRHRTSLDWLDQFDHVLEHQRLC